MEFLFSSAFRIGLPEIVWLGIVRSGDNAAAIALTARPKSRAA